jgi:hypothetical protein
MNNDFTDAMDRAQELMGGGIPFWDAVAQGLDESGTAGRWKREEAERKTGRRPCRHSKKCQEARNGI